ncbi:hypothetical protein [Desulfobotulus mexicanus]|uniref:RelA/SpoT domain-containing protein n=1 Tax=Desulfobotulus mexicanus TaxID=2586642 RepID=A0A5S5MFB5_9BACT|nr:hypothetical protein [Desulfobotulus mexicanus]TYT74367.1 hypothetical protein FIM25_10420 [Desulfobotulus mexicanus]
MNLYSTSSIAKSIAQEIESILYGVGLLFRVFYRSKQNKSVADKISRNPGKYSKGKKLIQDVIGIRIALYFPDDVDLVVTLLKSHFNNIEIVKDAPDVFSFGPSRLNMVFSIPTEYDTSLSNYYNTDCIDNTFEVQVRTILSEGWHEVEHDLRYKCKNDWESFDNLSRMLNGVLASLETSEWTMVKIFESLAWQHYKLKQWESMLRNKFRLNFQGSHLSEELINLLNTKQELAKQLFRSNRQFVLLKIHAQTHNLPITMDNICHLTNFFEIFSEELMELMPDALHRLLLGNEAP